ncbi:MAG TPA: helix-turn-helix domain-containing protein [Arthrobacter sp.]|nr:helix-turn-helix domain-containing protein [Arthrobacter sp.]
MTAAPQGPGKGPGIGPEKGLEKGPENSPEVPLPPAPRRPAWTFLTNHGHVLLSVAADPQARITDIAAKVGITPRSTLQILKDLEDGGYLHRVRAGRRTRYAIEPHQHFRHPATANWEIDGLIGLFSGPASSAEAVPQRKAGE